MLAGTIFQMSKDWDAREIGIVDRAQVEVDTLLDGIQIPDSMDRPIISVEMHEGTLMLLPKNNTALRMITLMQEFAGPPREYLGFTEGV